MKHANFCPNCGHTLPVEGSPAEEAAESPDEESSEDEMPSKAGTHLMAPGKSQKAAIVIAMLKKKGFGKK